MAQYPDDMTQDGIDRRDRRIDARRSATLIDSDGSELAVTIVDISASGFRVETGNMLMVGEMVRLKVDKSGDFPAQIRWCLGQEAGGAFLDAAAAA